MNDEARNESLPYGDELSRSLRSAVEHVCSEPQAEEAMQRALHRARQLETPAAAAEVEGQADSRARIVLPGKRVTNTNRRTVMFTRIAAAVLAAVGITGLFSWSPFGGASVAFAHVQETLDKVRSVTFDATSQAPGQPENKSRVQALGSRHVRMELPDGQYIVLDLKEQKSLVVRPQESRAVVVEGRQPNGPQDQVDLYRRLRNLRAKAVEEMPGKTIDGKMAPGFRVVDQQQTMRVWIDPDTKLPLRIESTRYQQDGTELTEVADNFVFDRELDPSLFSTDAPDGYAVETRTFPKQADSPSETTLVLTPKVGLGPAHFGMTKDEVIAALGKPDVTAKSAAGGETLRYDTQGFWISLGPDNKLEGVALHAHPTGAAPVAQTFAGKISEGIAMGASQNEISKALGPPNYLHERDSKFGKVTTMAYWDLGLNLSLRNDSLEEMSASLPKTSDN